MKPLIHEIEQHFSPLREEELTAHSTLIHMRQQTALLMPYEHYAVQFYPEFYRFLYENKEWIVFGQDLGGYFVLSWEGQWIGYLYQEEDSHHIAYCNDTWHHFISFYHAFTSAVLQQLIDKQAACTDRVLDLDSLLDTLTHYYMEIDAQAMQEEHHFWAIRLYELSAGFFPLDGQRIAMYHSLE